MPSTNPYEIVADFESRIAEWAGSKYAVAVESCSAAIFLSLQRKKVECGQIGTVFIPSHTYPSTPCSIIHCGGRIVFRGSRWYGQYELHPYGIWDAALKFHKNMYRGGFQCLSFHVKKHLPIGRGGMILLNDEEAYKWLLKARFDGRSPIPLQEDSFTQLGWNMYMSVEQAARGIELFEVLRRKHPDGLEDLRFEDQGYPDLSLYPIYQQ